MHKVQIYRSFLGGKTLDFALPPTFNVSFYNTVSHGPKDDYIFLVKGQGHQPIKQTFSRNSRIHMLIMTQFWTDVEQDEEDEFQTLNVHKVSLSLRTGTIRNRDGDVSETFICLISFPFIMPVWLCAMLAAWLHIWQCHLVCVMIGHSSTRALAGISYQLLWWIAMKFCTDRVHRGFSSCTSARLTFLGFSKISWQLMDGLLWNLVQTCMAPRWHILF